MSDDLAPQQSEATPSIDHADASILESWNTIRAAEGGGDGDQPADTAPATRARDASGKFTAAAPAAPASTDQPADIQTDQAAAPADELKPPPKESPKSWRKEVADKHWGALAPDLQEAILEREQAYSAGIERYRAGAEAAQRFEQVYRPYEATLRQVGASPEQAVEAFFKADHTLRYGSPAQKAAQLAQIAQGYGVSLEQVQSHIQNPPPPVDPMVQGLRSEVDALKAQQQQRENEQAQARLNQLTSEVEAFAKGKEHFGAVQEEIMMVLPGINERFPQLSTQEKLQRAYDIAVNANPTVRAAIAAQQQAAATAEAQKKAAEARKAASVNVPQRGVIPAAGPALSMDETIRAKAAELGLA